jgi:IS5 family transposase
MFQPGFFDVENRLQALSEFGDPLEKLSSVIDFETFRKTIEQVISFSNKERGGRPAWDSVLMFKILILQTLYTISDEQLEFQIKDRLSFQRFLGLRLNDKVPDAKTVWVWRERFKKDNLMGKAFHKFDQDLKAKGYLAMSGQIIDASIVQSPRQRNTKHEKEEIKQGKIPEEWVNNPNKLAQKDRDARWMVKHSKAKVQGEEKAVDIAIPQFGYKNHISTDKLYGLIRRFDVSAANMYDGRVFEGLLDPENTASSVFADTAYGSKENRDLLAERGLKSEICLKKPKGKVMEKNVKRGNKRRASVRANIEHVFAVQKDKMALFIRTIGIERARVKIGFANLVYNMKRLIFLERSGFLTA